MEEWEPLERHLREVALLAQVFARPFSAGDWAYLAGLWHDLGKYRPAFQSYLRASAADPDASPERRGTVDHSTVGAIHAASRLGATGAVLGYVIAGHHAGLPDGQGGDASLAARIDRRELLAEALGAQIPREVLEPPPPSSGPRTRKREDLHLWIRLLFSCLTDADFLATEGFMAPDRAGARTTWPTLPELLPQFEAFVTREFGNPRSPVSVIREKVRRWCVEAAELEPGIFSLTVPTGGGKTLSSLAFALHHAARYGKRRIIYVIPYTSIIEQTADVFRRVFAGTRYVLEHHSNVDPEDPERSGTRMRLAAENWDAPVIVTTNVQFFESFFSSRSSRCRKLHNVVDSVVILDEAQLLPPGFLKPITGLIESLAKDYGVTFVVSTATQPALGLARTREIVPDIAGLSTRLQRVRYEWPADGVTNSWEEIAQAIALERQVLCVVNTRGDARTLAELVPEAIHLSALMCGEHRSRRISEIKALLKAGQPARVVSTQLVEAGVDLDFPVVFRAFSGLDSIAQAAGRCNREGALPDMGRVVVFNPPKPSPRGLLRKAENASHELLASGLPEHLEPAFFRRFFELFFYAHVNSLDEKGIVALLDRQQPLDIAFREASSLFQLVDDSAYLPVVVRYERGAELIDELRRAGIHRELGRRLQRYIVSIPSRQASALTDAGAVVEASPGLYVQADSRIYDDVFGLNTTTPEYDPQSLIT